MGGKEQGDRYQGGNKQEAGPGRAGSSASMWGREEGGRKQGEQGTGVKLFDPHHHHLPLCNCFPHCSTGGMNLR